MSMAIAELKRFQTDRNLQTMPFDVVNESANIVEELLEAQGLDVAKSDRPLLKAEFIGFVAGAENFTTPIEVDSVDAFADIIVFAVGALMKMGYEPDDVLMEASKEINSRVGEMVDGKFEKDLSNEAQSNWYKADYTNCKLKEA